MNIKKMFTTLSAMVVACAMLLPNASVLAASYSQELQDAYNWAYSKGVTTMSPIDNANMYGAITRAEMAKMLSVYATEVLGMTPDTTAACTFSDIASVKGDLHDYIIESCQLGIMGQGISAFRPYDTISRAEFGTALSRVLWGSQYEGGTPYYAKHLDALKAAGIMTQISNAESTKEIRGYVMLMLMRSEGNDAVVDCDDPMTVIACTTDTDACPAACKEAASDETDEIVKSGDLAVKSSASDDRKVVVASNALAVSDLDTLTFKTSEEVTLNRVVLEKYGYSDAKNLVSKVWLEDENGTVITNKANVTDKGLATLTLKKDYKVVDGTLNATIVLETNTGATVGGTIGFKVKDVTSSAANVDLGNYKAYQYDVVSYNGTEATVEARGGEKSYNYEAGESYEIAKFKVKAPQDTSIFVRGFTLKNEGELDIAKFLDKVTVKVAGKEVKATTKISKNDLTISLSSDVELSAKKTLEVVVSASLNDEFDEYGDDIHFSMASAGLSATDKNDARITVDTSKAVFVEYTFNGGKVKLANTKLGNVDAALGSVDVKIAEGTITISEPVEGDVTFTIKGVDGSEEAIDTVSLFIGEDEFEGTITNNVAKFEDVEIAESGKVRVIVSLKEEIEGEGRSITFGSLEWDLEYTDGEGDAETSGVSISPSKLNLTAAQGSLTNSLTSQNDAEFKNNESNTILVFDGTYTAKKQDVNLQDWSIAGSGLAALNPKTTVKFFVTVDDEEDEDEYKNGIAEGSLSEEVLVKVGESVKVRVEAQIEANEAEVCTGEDDEEVDCVFPIDLGKFSLTLSGFDMNDNPAGGASRKTVNLSIVKVGSVTIETPSTAKTVLRKAADQSLASVTVKPDGNSEATIESVEVVYDATLDTSRGTTDMPWDEVFTLYVDGTSVEFEVDTTHKTITAEGLSVPVKSAGVVVELELNEEAAIDFTVSSITVNNEKSNKPFRKFFVPALVKINSQNDDGMATVFKYSVDKKNTDHVYGVQLQVNNKWLSVNGGEEITNGFEEEVLDGTESYYVTAIKYCLELKDVAAEDCTGDATDEEVGLYVIEKSDFNDFFRIGSSYARVNAKKN